MRSTPHWPHLSIPIFQILHPIRFNKQENGLHSSDDILIITVYKIKFGFTDDNEPFLILFSKITISATMIHHVSSCCLLSISCNLVDNATS